jgi:hypothetical protein
VADDICGEGKGVMQRIIYLNSQPLLLAQQIAVQKDFEIITPAQLAAKALGVPKRSLSDIAQKIVQKQGIQVAPALIAQQTLHSVISQTTTGSFSHDKSVTQSYSSARAFRFILIATSSAMGAVCLFIQK